MLEVIRKDKRPKLIDQSWYQKRSERLTIDQIIPMLETEIMLSNLNTFFY